MYFRSSRFWDLHPSMLGSSHHLYNLDRSKGPPVDGSPMKVKDQITGWIRPNVSEDTQYGYITNMAWLKKEQERIAKYGVQTTIKRGVYGCALFRI